MSRTIRRLPAVKAQVGLQRTQIYQLIREGRFPPPIKISTRARGWLADEVDRWLEERIAQSRSSTINDAA